MGTRAGFHFSLSIPVCVVSSPVQGWKSFPRQLLRCRNGEKHLECPIQQCMDYTGIHLLLLLKNINFFFPLNCHVLFQLSHSHVYKTKPWSSWDYCRFLGGLELGGKRWLGNEGRIPTFPYPKKKIKRSECRQRNLFLLDSSVHFCH